MPRRRCTIEASQSPIQLTYGQQPPAWRRRRTWILLFVIASVAISAYLAWPRATKWYATYEYRRDAKQWYAQAATWSEPPTKLKYTENPEDAPSGKFVRSYGRSGATTYTGFRSFGGHPVERLPRFYAGGIPALAATPDQVHLFMHERTTSAGLTRLIAVHNPGFDGDQLSLSFDLIGLLNGQITSLRGGARDVDMTGIAGPGEIRLYAGQPDPTDKSRFTIPFEARGRRGWIDGVFKTGVHTSTDPENARIEQEMNSIVEFEVRLEPATQPAGTRPAR